MSAGMDLAPVDDLADIEAVAEEIAERADPVAVRLDDPAIGQVPRPGLARRGSWIAPCGICWSISRAIHIARNFASISSTHPIPAQAVWGW